LLDEGPCALDFRDLAGREVGHGDELAVLLSRLSGAAISSVLLVRIDTAPLDGLAVVRLVIPQLQPLLQG
jgi:hypothetical protein